MTKTAEKLAEKGPYVHIPPKLENRLDINELCKNDIIYWLDENGYKTEATKIEFCSQTVAHFECVNGHEKYVRLHCKREHCPICGAKDSQLHQKRVARSVDRLFWAPILGYMVFTLPREVSDNMPDKTQLSALLVKAGKIVKANFDTPGNMSRVHLMGKEPGILHIHINVVFPIEAPNNKGAVSLEVLDSIRQEWTDYVNKTFALGCKNTNVFYKFAIGPEKQMHVIKYVLRPIVTPSKFIGLTDDDKHKILGLKGWHNTRWYGQLANNKYKKFLEAKGIDPSAHLDKDIGLRKDCPCCGSKYRFIDTMWVNDLPNDQLRCVDKNTWIDRLSFSLIFAKSPP